MKNLKNVVEGAFYIGLAITLAYVSALLVDKVIKSLMLYGI